MSAAHICICRYNYLTVDMIDFILQQSYSFVVTPTGFLEL
jgi:hypothetical protein